MHLHKVKVLVLHPKFLEKRQRPMPDLFYFLYFYLFMRNTRHFLVDIRDPEKFGYAMDKSQLSKLAKLTCKSYCLWDCRFRISPCLLLAWSL